MMPPKMSGRSRASTVLGLGRLALVLSLVLAGLGPRLAHAQAPEETRVTAKRHYESGARKFDMGKFAEAAEDFQKAYELVGDPAILYNIAKSYQLAENPERARFFYQSYLRRLPGAPNRAEVESRIKDLDKVLSQQKRAAEKPPTGILRPEEKQPTPPTASTEQRPTPPEPPKPVTAEPPPPVLAPQEPPPPETPAPVEATSGGPPKILRPLAYGLFVLGGASLVVGGVMSGLAASGSSRISEAAQAHGAWTNDARDLESRSKTYDKLAIVSYVVGGAAAAGGAVCLYLSLRGEKAASVAPVVGQGTAGIVISGNF